MDFNDLIYRIYDKYRIFQVIFMDGIPFLELWPEYHQELICNLILEFAALFLLTLLIVQFFRRKHRSFELTLFFQMCLIDVAMTLCSIGFESVLKLWAPKMSKTITMGDGLFLMICDPVKDMVTNRFIQLLSEQAVNEGIPVDISYETDTNAPLDQIISRYI